jgi:D-arabinose 1-dehydrogenase-like Zn-dependent alcohol dehydrogenase
VFVDCTIRARDDPSVIILQGHLRGDDQKSHRILWEQWRDGALQQFYKVPMENVFPLDEDRLLGELKYTPAELPTLVLYLVAAGALIDVAKVKTGETVVIGPSGGAFGGSAVELALTLGANVIALGRNKEKLAAMKDALGNPTRLQYVVMTGNEAKDGAAIKEATPKGQGFDVYNDWTPGGSPKPLYLPAIVHGIKVGGRMIMSGSSDGNVVFPYSDMLHKNLSLMGSFMYTRETIPMIINMVTSGMLAGIGRKDGAEVTVFGLDQHVEAIEHAAKNGAWRRYTMIAPNVE